MTRKQSGLDTWSFFARSGHAKDSIEGYLPIILSAAGAIGIGPFAVIRFMNGQWLAGIIDVLLMAGIIGLGTIVYRTRRTRYAALTIAVLCVGGVVSTVYFVGPQQVYWAYPALMAIFYLIRPTEAVLLSLTMIALLIPSFLPAVERVETTTVFITIVVMSTFGYAFSVVTNRQRTALLNLATRDSLTGAGNRRALDAKLDEVIQKSKREPILASLIMLDLDHFKSVNDKYGHAAGDQILKDLAEIIKLRIRVTDSLFRIGGEEFVVVLDGQDRTRAQHLAEQLRTLVAANELVPDHDVTISLGVAELVPEEDGTEWLRRADEAMYEAKRVGRNVTRLAS